MSDGDPLGTRVRFENFSLPSPILTFAARRGCRRIVFATQNLSWQMPRRSTNEEDSNGGDLRAAQRH
jgi:hypothetical protein